MKEEGFKRQINEEQSRPSHMLCACVCVCECMSSLCGMHAPASAIGYPLLLLDVHGGFTSGGFRGIEGLCIRFIVPPL